MSIKVVVIEEVWGFENFFNATYHYQIIFLIENFRCIEMGFKVDL
jgi:hypothetical protein